MMSDGMAEEPHTEVGGVGSAGQRGGGGKGSVRITISDTGEEKKYKNGTWTKKTQYYQ